MANNISTFTVRDTKWGGIKFIAEGNKKLSKYRQCILFFFQEVLFFYLILKGELAL